MLIMAIQSTGWSKPLIMHTCTDSPFLPKYLQLVKTDQFSLFAVFSGREKDNHASPTPTAEPKRMVITTKRDKTETNTNFCDVISRSKVYIRTVILLLNSCTHL